MYNTQRNLSQEGGLHTQRVMKKNDNNLFKDGKYQEKYLERATLRKYGSQNEFKNVKIVHHSRQEENMFIDDGNINQSNDQNETGEEKFQFFFDDIDADDCVYTEDENEVTEIAGYPVQTSNQYDLPM